MTALEQAQARIDELQRQLTLRDNQVAELTAALGEANQREERLQGQLTRLLRRLYGPKSEAFIYDPSQLVFDDILGAALEQARDAGVADPFIAPEAAPAEPPRRQRNRHNHGRLDLELLEGVLQCEDVIVDVEEDEKLCPETGEPMVAMGQEITRKLEMVPGRIIIRRYIRPKFVSPQCPEAGVVLAQLPTFPIPKCKLDVGLIADILVSKYTDHKPLYRIERALGREGVTLARSTMSGIAVRCGAEVLLGLYRCLTDFVLSFDYIFSDDTGMPMQIQHLPKSLRDELGSPRMWTYGNVEAPRQVVYDFTLNRGKEGPEAFLARYSGFLQADAYAGYDVVFNRPDGAVIELGCNVHARRRFEEAMDSSPRLASEILASYQELFKIERRADEAKIDCPLKRLAIRREYSAPIVEAMYQRMAAMVLEVLPKSPIAGAIGYAMNQRKALTRFLEDGRFRLDNNWAENHMRPLALGRGNYLFVGSPRGGLAAAVIYSFTESCRLAGVNPVEYFKDVLWRINSHPPDRLPELLPCNWEPGPPPGRRIIMPPMPRGQPARMPGVKPRLASRRNSPECHSC